jgi:methyl-accepting chemotaxis protein
MSTASNDSPIILTARTGSADVESAIDSAVSTARQTNLLALDALIAAGRAGADFAGLAADVRALASTMATAAASVDAAMAVIPKAE